MLPESELLVQDPRFVSFHDKMRDWNFRYGATPNFSHKIEAKRLLRREGATVSASASKSSGRGEKSARVSDMLATGDAPTWGTFETHLQVGSGAAIEKCVVFSDTLFPDVLDRVMGALAPQGKLEKVRYDGESVRRALSANGPQRTQRA